MKRPGATLAALSLVATGATRAWSCPCSDDPSAGAFLTRAGERYALSLLASSRRAQGAFDVSGAFHALGDGELQASEELLLRGALRAPERLEWQLELGASSYRFRTQRVFDDQVGLGDAQLRARYALRREGMPHESLRWPALSAAAFVRAPLGAMTTSRPSSFGSGGAQLGLGAWELGAACDVSRTVLFPELVPFASLEVGYRLPDDSLGRDRQLGPRLSLALGARFEAAPWLSASLAVAGRFVDDVRLSGRALDGTAERLVSVAAALGASDAATGFRSSLGLSVDPPLRGLSLNAVATTALSVSLGVSR